MLELARATSGERSWALRGRARRSICTSSSGRSWAGLPFLRRPHARSQNISWKGCCNCARLRCPCTSLFPRARNGIPAQSHWARRSRTCDTCAVSGPMRLSRSVLLYEGVLTSHCMPLMRNLTEGLLGVSGRAICSISCSPLFTALPQFSLPPRPSLTHAPLADSLIPSRRTRVRHKSHQMLGQAAFLWAGIHGRKGDCGLQIAAHFVSWLEGDTKLKLRCVLPIAQHTRASRRAEKSVRLPRSRPQGNCVPTWQATVGPLWCRDSDIRTEEYHGRTDGKSTEWRALN